MIFRKDLGIRIGAQKAQKADEVLTRSQLLPGNNISFEYFGPTGQNAWDIKIHALQSSVGVGGLRDLHCIISLTRSPQNILNQKHYDLQDSEGSGSVKKYFGSMVYADIKHFWDLPSPNMFQYSFVDMRRITETASGRVDSLPTVVGIDGNTVRIIATDPKIDTRFNPLLWVDTELGEQTNTKFINFKNEGYVTAEQNSIEATPIYSFRLTEVIDPNPAYDVTFPTNVV